MTEKKQKQTQLAGVNLIKFVMAFAVVAIHSKTMTDGQVYADWITWLISLAVPFFFVVCGFFTARRLVSFESAKDKNDYLWNHAKKSLRLYVSWLIIYLPVAVMYYITKGESFSVGLLKYIYSVLLLGESPYAWTLWYIYSTFFFFLIARLLFCRKGGQTVMAVLFFGAYLIGFCGRHYGSNPSQIIDSLCVRLIGGGNYIMIGMWLYKIMPRLTTRIKAITIIGSLALSFVLVTANLPFATQFGGIAVLLFALGLDFKCPARINIWLRVQSMLIYFCHMMILFALTGLVRAIGNQVSLAYAFVTTSVITLLFTICAYPLFTRVKPFTNLIQ